MKVLVGLSACLRDACVLQQRSQCPMSSHKWSGRGWTVTVTETEMVLAQASGSVAISSPNAARLEVRRRWFRWGLHNEGQPLARLRGITKTEAVALSQALRRLPLALAIADAVAWSPASVSRRARTGNSGRRAGAGFLIVRGGDHAEVVDPGRVGRGRRGRGDRAVDMPADHEPSPPWTSGSPPGTPSSPWTWPNQRPTCATT